MVLSRDILLLIVAAVIILISGYRPFSAQVCSGKATTFFSDYSGVLAQSSRRDIPARQSSETESPVGIFCRGRSLRFSGFHYSFVTPLAGLARESKEKNCRR